MNKVLYVCVYCQLYDIFKSLTKLGKVFNYGAFNNNQLLKFWGKLNLFFMPGDIGETFGEKMQSLFLHENPQVNTLFS